MLSSPAIMPSSSHASVERNAVSLIALIVGAAAVGFSPIFVRLSELGPTASAFWRVALAAPALWIWALTCSQNAVKLQRARALAVAAVGLSFAGDLSFWHWSIKLTSVANATLLANLSVLFVPLATWLLFRKRISTTFLAGLTLALAGTAALMGRSFDVNLQRPLGDLLGVVTAMFYSIYLLATKYLRDAGYATATIMSWGTSITALALLPVAVLSGEEMLPHSVYGWSILLALALISQAGGQTLIAYSLAKLPAAFSSVALLLEPVVAAALAWPLFGERLGTLEIVGAVLVLAGIYIAHKGSSTS